MAFMDSTYRKESGSIVGYRETPFGGMERTLHIPQSVRDTFRFHRCDEVRVSGLTTTPIWYTDHCSTPFSALSLAEQRRRLEEQRERVLEAQRAQRAAERDLEWERASRARTEQYRRDSDRRHAQEAQSELAAIGAVTLFAGVVAGVAALFSVGNKKKAAKV